jgi:hypothetical protein
VLCCSSGVLCCAVPSPVSQFVRVPVAKPCIEGVPLSREQGPDVLQARNLELVRPPHHNLPAGAASTNTAAQCFKSQSRGMLTAQHRHTQNTHTQDAAEVSSPSHSNYPASTACCGSLCIPCLYFLCQQQLYMSLSPQPQRVDTMQSTMHPTTPPLAPCTHDTPTLPTPPPVQRWQQTMW